MGCLSLGRAYVEGLELLATAGRFVPSVTDPTSKASNFGQGDRPYREVINHTFRVDDPSSLLVTSTAIPTKLSYAFGLAAWSLDSRDDVSTLAYYRKGAYEYSDDAHTLSGAFGHRLFGDQRGSNQIRAVIERIRKDPSHRRTWASIITPEDNFRTSREYPCAAGVQLFLRDGALTWLTTMRAQQALTVLPYDAFLFMVLHQVAASLLDTGIGDYLHSSGTFHIYEDEVDTAKSIITQGVPDLSLPRLPAGRRAVESAVAEFVSTELCLRQAVANRDRTTVDRISRSEGSGAFVDLARACLATFALRQLGEPDAVVRTAATGPFESLF